LNIIIIGAGIVGLASAYELSREGHVVTVIEAAPGSGLGASGGNGAQLSYSYVQPLADPGIWRQLPKLLFKSDSPLKFQARFDLQQAKWLAQFMWACRTQQARATTEHLLKLATLSRSCFEQMMACESIDCDYSQNGKLVLYRTDESFKSAQNQLALQRQLGSVQQALSPAETLAMEPALQGSNLKLSGAIYTPSEGAVDCQKLCDALVTKLQERGVAFHFNSRVESFSMRNGQLRELRTRRTIKAQNQGQIEEPSATPRKDQNLDLSFVADRYVISAGIATAKLVQDLGARIPVYALKGYSVTLPVQQGKENAPCAPKINITDSAVKTVFAPLGRGSNARLRVAGFVEIGTPHNTLPEERFKALLASAQSLFPSTFSNENLRPSEAWSGLRPATPTGLPIVGHHPKLPGNVLLNCGQGALGLTLAFGCARQLSKILVAPSGKKLTQGKN
jgi:D-amino-acid dehydrogenase